MSGPHLLEDGGAVARADSVRRGLREQVPVGHNNAEVHNKQVGVGIGWVGGGGGSIYRAIDSIKTVSDGRHGCAGGAGGYSCYRMP